MLNKYQSIYSTRVKMQEQSSNNLKKDDVPKVDLKDHSILLSEKEVRYIGEIVVVHDLSLFTRRDSRLLFPAVDIEINKLSLYKEYNKEFKIGGHTT